jgi:preprotein translocase subunit SecG
MLAAFAYSFFLGVFIALFVLVSLLLILIVLIQKGRGGGLASAFGGGGGNTAFGSKTGDVLTWATSIIFGVFVLLAVILNLMTRPVAKPVLAGPPPSVPSQSSPLKPAAPSTPAPTATPEPAGTTPAPTVLPGAGSSNATPKGPETNAPASKSPAGQPK